MAGITEREVEDAALQWLAGLGYAVLHGPDIGPEGPAPERGSYDEVLLAGRLRKALARINPHLPAETLEGGLRKVRQAETPSLIEENRRLHRYLRGHHRPQRPSVESSLFCRIRARQERHCFVAVLGNIPDIAGGLRLALALLASSDATEQA